MKQMKVGALVSVAKVALFVLVCTIGANLFAKPLIYLPFRKGARIYCIQGNNTNYSHNGTLKYAYDFVEKGYGEIFGENLLSPINGEIVEMRDGAPDYQYNNVSILANNYGWGNTLLIKDDATGIYVRVAHLKDESIQHEVVDKVKIGTIIGKVGNSGWSTEAHLHIHLQELQASTAQSIKFGFVEGVFSEGRWAYSDLTPKSFVIDEGDDITLSHNITLHNTYMGNGMSAHPNHIHNQLVDEVKYRDKYSKTDKKKKRIPWFSWRFKVKEKGYYFIYAKYNSTSKKDPHAKYSLIKREPNKWKCTTKYVDMTKKVQDNWYFIMYTYLSPEMDCLMKLRAQTVNTYIEADALMFVKVF